MYGVIKELSGVSVASVYQLNQGITRYKLAHSVSVKVKMNDTDT